MTTLTLAAPATIKGIDYNRETRDYDMFLDGEYVGSAACYHSAEVELDRLTYEQLDRTSVEPELALSTTALDSGSSQDEIAAEYAAALPTCKACHTNIYAPSELQPAFCTECVDAMLRGRKNRLDSGHNLTLPDPAECPDISAPQPVNDLPTAQVEPEEDSDDEDDYQEGDPRDEDVYAPPFGLPVPSSAATCTHYSTPPSLALWGPDTPECPKCGQRHDPVVACPKTVVAVAPEPERDPCAELRAALEEALDLFAYEFCYSDGTVIRDRTTGQPMNAGGKWVERARAALEG